MAKIGASPPWALVTKMGANGDEIDVEYKKGVVWWGDAKIAVWDPNTGLHLNALGGKERNAVEEAIAEFEF